MADAATAQLIHPPDRLRERLGARFPGIEADAAARAAEALKRLSGEFEAWLEAEAARLGAARDAFDTDATPAARQELHRCAHDLKGLAGTCGFPLVTRVCSSLCRLLEEATGRPPPDLLHAHVDAVRTLLRDAAGVSTNAGITQCAALEARTAAFVGGGDPRG